MSDDILVEKNLYQITGEVLDINTLLINRNTYNEMQEKITTLTDSLARAQIRDETNFYRWKKEVAGHNPDKISDHLKLFLNTIKNRYSISSGKVELDWLFVKDMCVYMYYHDLSLQHCLHHTVKAYVEAMNDKRFELACPGDLADQLENILSIPLNTTWITATNLDTPTTLRKVYEGIITKLLIGLLLTNIGWCRDQLTLDT